LIFRGNLIYCPIQKQFTSSILGFLLNNIKVTKYQ
jgi:hypothetical protein